MKKIFVACVMLGITGFLFWADNAAAKTPRIRKPRQVISLKASQDSLARQNRVIDAYGLPRIADRRELARFLPEHFFVKVSSPYLEMADDVGGYATIPTRDFVLELGQDFFAAFKHKLKISSLLRTAEDQRKIAAEGRSIADGSAPELQSSHLAGISFDISKKPLSEQERQWLLKKLFAYKKEGKIEAIEEMWNNAFHVFVCPNWQTGSCF